MSANKWSWKMESLNCRRYLNRVSYSILPVTGAISHTAFAVHILDRSLLGGCFPKWHLAVANGLLFNAHLGVGLYIYSRPCLQKASISHRVLFSLYGSAMFNFGSVLLFGTGKQVLLEDRLIGSIYAILASLCFLCVGKYFFDFLDRQVDSRVDVDDIDNVTEAVVEELSTA
ncbi:uncharacterized protein LOC100890508 [Strongylocentrotus purpuratus]|uniref:Uncharacterized protein n=1 Tax=Strongylocentrotus purpuratus TaxID=7668 RepID=A0A7M7GII3_STRPU|nr:uncharacterized protein LOC100890508 [Strongylocentrotus purpuratus]|eukprot:XP_003729526.1 PREDICTED: uncharacterized protein LOC100890508 [Strongylocentrotus purpuratus]